MSFPLPTDSQLVDEIDDIRDQLKIMWLALGNTDWLDANAIERVQATLEKAETRLKVVSRQLGERIPEVTLADLGLEAAHV